MNPADMDPNELADCGKAVIDRAHELIDEYPCPKGRAKLLKKLAVFHAAGDKLLTLAKDLTHPDHGGPVVTPFSGGEPKVGP